MTTEVPEEERAAMSTLGPHFVRACAGCRDGADDHHAYKPLTDEEWLDRLAQLESTIQRITKERDEARAALADAREMLHWTLDYIDPYKHVACDIFDFLGTTQEAVLKEQHLLEGPGEKGERT